MTVTETAFAKLNLCLDAVGRRPDGYHELVSVMQTVSLCDKVTVTRTAGRNVTLSTNGDLPTDGRNLAVRAAGAYFEAAGTSFGADIVLEKTIPVQAGLGGGSADAAAVLRALNALDNGRFTIEQLCAVGARVGADVPFCVAGGTRLCRGIGERMTPIECRLSPHVVVAVSGEGISTPRAFADLDARYPDLTRPAAEAEARLPAMIAALREGDLVALAASMYNRFEEVIEPLRPAVSALKKVLLAHDALAARMSGSGPAVFGLFETEQSANACAAALCAAGAQAFTCTFVS